jgi:hypothetical protein
MTSIAEVLTPYYATGDWENPTAKRKAVGCAGF